MIQNRSFQASRERPDVQGASLVGAGLCRLQDCSLIAEADHRIANHLAMLAGHVRLKAAKLARHPETPARAAVGLLLGIEAEIAAVARLHRQLSGRMARGPADLAQELHEVCAPFQAGLSGDVVLLEDFEAGCAATADQILPLAQIVTEVITNALKYAYAEDRGGCVVVRLRRAGQDAAVIEIADHGPGFAASFDPARDGGLGFRVVRALADQLHATATFTSSGEGVRFKLTLPMAQDARTPGDAER
ncbi:MAG: sensor histidine kinase [Caulobacterales bacterium]|jgi:two-component sensor histidine kinase